MRTIFTIKSTENQKSKYKPGSDYYLGQTLSQIETKNRGFINIFGTRGSRQSRGEISRLKAGDKARVEGENPHLPPLNDTPVRRDVFAIKNLPLAALASGS